MIEALEAILNDIPNEKVSLEVPSPDPESVVASALRPLDEDEIEDQILHPDPAVSTEALLRSSRSQADQTLADTLDPMGMADAPPPADSTRVEPSQASVPAAPAPPAAPVAPTPQGKTTLWMNVGAVALVLASVGAFLASGGGQTSAPAPAPDPVAAPAAQPAPPPTSLTAPPVAARKPWAPSPWPVGSRPPTPSFAST